MLVDRDTEAAEDPKDGAIVLKRLADDAKARVVDHDPLVAYGGADGGEGIPAAYCGGGDLDPVEDRGLGAPNQRIRLGF